LTTRVHTRDRSLIIFVMEIQVTTEIQALLYEHETVVIPGLGAFVCEYQEAVVDPYAGKLSPPSYLVRFDDDLQINDGILQDFIKRKYSLSSQEAQSAIAEFVSQTEAALNMHELVSFDQVGRLYRDYSKRLQFVPESTNFNPDSFGLKSVDYQPITRTQSSSQGVYPPARSVSDTDNSHPSATQGPSSPILERENLESLHLTAAEMPSKSNANPVAPDKQLPPSVETVGVPAPIPTEKPATWWKPLHLNDFMPSLVVAALLGVAGTIYVRSEDKKGVPPPISRPTIAPKAVAKTTPVVQGGSDAIVPEVVQLETPAQRTTIASEHQLPTAEAQKGVVEVPSPKLKKSIIIVAAYKTQVGGAGILQQLQQMGYKTYVGKRNDKIIFGCQMGYNDAEDLAKSLEQVREKFGKDCWILKK
jgi:CCDC81-like prokaryotic HU domain 1/CCDC81-like prokaryotic HU domain 2